MNEHATNPRIIIDANYIRGTSKDGAPFRAICEQGGRIVLIDTLIYELCTTCDTNQWRASMNKLKAGVDAIEVWEHISPMYEVELKENRPYGDPLNHEITKSTRKMITNNSQYQPADMKKLIKSYVKAREGQDMLVNLLGLRGSRPPSGGVGEKMKQAPHDEEVVQFCYNRINNPDNIRLDLKTVFRDLMKETWVRLNPDKVDEKWIIWHLCKLLLTVSLDCRHQGDQTLGKKLINTKHDLDYLISLAFADALASCETTGAMSYYRKWMFGDAKPQLCSLDPDEIACFMNKLSNRNGGRQ